MRSLLRYGTLALVFFLAGLASIRPHAEDSACPPTATPTALATQVDIAALPTASADAGTRKNPVPLGQVVHITSGDKTEQYDMAITDVRRGDDAWSVVHAGDNAGWNSTPTAAQEYIALHIVFHYVVGPQDKAELFTSQFAIVGNNVIYKTGATVFTDGFQPQLFPGGEAEGWAAVLIDKGVADPVAVWGMGYDGTGGAFFALK